MSRLIVKNLPENIKEARLREVFSNYGGEITDLKLCFTKKGVFRKFAFVGYKTDNDASTALKSLHKTFIDTSKITVEKCVNFGEETDTPRPWSKYSKGSSAFRRHTKEIEDRKNRIQDLQSRKKKEAKKTKKSSEDGDCKDEMENDPKFQEFLSLHMSENKKKLWCDEIGDVASEKKADAKTTKGKVDDGDSGNDDGKTSESSEEEDDSENGTGLMSDEMKDCVTVKMRGIPFKSKEIDVINFFKPLKVLDIRFAVNEKGKRSGYAFVDFPDSRITRKAMKKDRGEMRGRYIELFLAPHKQNSTKSDKHANAEPADVSDTGRLFLRNLSYTCTEEDLQNLFSTYGSLVEVHLPIDKNSNKSTGFAFVTYMMPEHAMKAWQDLDGKIFQGRILHIIPGRDKKTEDPNVDGSYKKKKEAEKKALSGSAHNWNALFLGQNAVAEVLSERLNKEKRDILGGESAGSVAVHMALGETELVNETKKFLQSYGVNLDVFGQASSARSKNVMLVKNLPPNTTKEELSEIFSKHGEMGRLLMPPFGITAIVEYIDSSDAKKAFQNLAYSKFKHTPLYLEWAPVGVLSGEVTAKPEEEDEEKDGEESDDDDENDEEDAEGKVLFVKNLNFDTNEAKLKAIFSSCGKVSEATIAKKKDPKKDGAMLSMGYGFVKFKNSADADKAIKNLQGSDLDGHKLELKRSHRETINPKSSRKRAVEKKQTSSKIVVRNIPFEANVKEVRDLFSSFGVIKSIRLPKKMAGTGSHRGFAFVDFVTKQEAKRAFNALCLSTHLYGRRLVLEWAEDDDSVDMLQQKTAQQYDHELEPQSKRTKQSLVSSLEGSVADE